MTPANTARKRSRWSKSRRSVSRQTRQKKWGKWGQQIKLIFIKLCKCYKIAQILSNRHGIQKGLTQSLRFATALILTKNQILLAFLCFLLFGILLGDGFGDGSFFLGDRVDLKDNAELRADGF
jgi:hypothetical protein